MVTNKEEKSALSPRQCTVSQVDRNNGKGIWIALQIASALTLSFRSAPQWLLAVCRPQKNAPGKNLAPIKKWYRKLRDILRTKTNRSTEKGIELLEKLWNQCITLEGDYVDE